MDRRRLLLVGLSAIALTLASSEVAYAEDTGTAQDSLVAGVIGSDPTSGVHDIVHLIGEISDDHGPVGGVTVVTHPEKADASEQPPPSDICSPTDPTDGCEPGAAAAPPGAQVVTLRDIASFRPVVPADVLEPDGWGLIGRPVNFVSGAVEQVVAGALLGRPAEVRFVPVGFEWGFGDGTSEAFAEPGASWAQLGLREFAETGTSHVYTDRGTFQVVPSVTYRAWYRFDGSGWVPIAGTLDIPGAARSILIGRIDTVLVAGDCHQYPNGPGC